MSQFSKKKKKKCTELFERRNKILPREVVNLPFFEKVATILCLLMRKFIKDCIFFFIPIWTINHINCNLTESKNLACDKQRLVRLHECRSWHIQFNRIFRRYLCIQSPLLWHKCSFHLILIPQGPVVQNLTKLLANMTLNFLSWNMANILIFFAEKMWVAFALQKLLTFLQQKIPLYLKMP